VDEDRVERGGWMANNWRKYEGWEDWSVLYVSDMTLYSIRSSILSQWSFFRTGVMYMCSGVFGF